MTRGQFQSSLSSGVIRVASAALRLPIIAAALVSLVFGVTAGRADDVVFSTDFDTSIPIEITRGTACLTGVQGYEGLGSPENQFGGTFLRSETGNVVTLTLTNLPPHSAISLEFLFAAIDSLDGSIAYDPYTGEYREFSGDFFQITLDNELIFDESLENANAGFVGTQSYIPPEGVELARHADLGFAGGVYWTDSAYDLGLDPIFHHIPHTASTAVFEFAIVGPGIQELEDESWAMDNLAVTIVPVDPAELLFDLVNEVVSLNLKHGIENSLDAKLDAALATFESQNANAAINNLYAFINAVEAQSDKAIPKSGADQLIANALEIIDLLNSP